AAPPEPPPVVRAALPKADPRPPAAPPPEGVAGTYALDRFSEKDTCRLALDVGALRVLDGCRDLGLTVFDPVSWRYDEGRITLFARRGHSVGLVPFGDGRWRRDPETGTTFVLRRVAP
ncbi:MAG: AprI/Inh family metalloprotease inhibitor, partial [Methylobacterium sp.]|uniref:AprI/Inh family metalloprotease inhibitor n=1 Tax=Methylobacterium sp. TaxID=409 RepID=UPI00258B0F17